MPAGKRNDGDFCWINMLTPQPSAACEFFGTLLGWTYGDIPGMGYTIKVGDQEIGGLFDLEGPNTPPGTPPSIGVMIKVANADAAVEKAKALGGSGKPPFDIADRLRMAECFDPNGAQFDIWESKSVHGTEVNSNVHGAPSWFENATTDMTRAATFYSALFNWKQQIMPMGEFDYITFQLGEAYVAGMMPILPDMGDMPPWWSTYFTVSNLDEALQTAASLGGIMCVPPQDVPNVGRFSGITSPQGVTFFVMQFLPSYVA